MAQKPAGYSFGNYMQTQYSNRPASVEYQRFKEEYFAGSDVRIYFGDIWVDEVVGLSFTLQENVAPIYGYASYTYDAVARGNRQINGSFRINFKESYYLHSIMNELDYKQGSVQGFQSDGIKGKKATAGSKMSPTSGGNSIEYLLSKAKTGNNQDFEDLATQFEDSLWGSSTNNDMTKFTNSRPTKSFFAPDGSNLAKNGFNIVILYGPYQQGYNGNSEQVATTVHTLTGVQLNGVNQVIDNNGQPVYEEYSFIARDLDGNVNLFGVQPYNQS